MTYRLEPGGWTDSDGASCTAEADSSGLPAVGIEALHGGWVSEEGAHPQIDRAIQLHVLVEVGLHGQERREVPR